MSSRPFSETMRELAVEDPDMLWEVVAGLLTDEEFCKEKESKISAARLMRDYLEVPQSEIERIINDPSCLAERGITPATAQS